MCFSKEAQLVLLLFGKNLDGIDSFGSLTDNSLTAQGRAQERMRKQCERMALDP